MTSPAPLLAARGLAVGHRDVVLAGVEFAVHAGESWFVLGDNGAGKSTLIATLLGVLPPRAGRVECAPAIADRSELGYVPQESRYGRALPIAAGEYVGMGIQPGIAAAARGERIAAALATMGLPDRARTPIGELSIGQRRRVLVARALARQPTLLVLDEPTANLDAKSSRQLAAELDSLRLQRGMAVLHVCHDRALAHRYASHVLFVEGGEAVAGPAELMWPRVDTAALR